MDAAVLELKQETDDQVTVVNKRDFQIKFAGGWKISYRTVQAELQSTTDILDRIGRKQRANRMTITKRTLGKTAEEKKQASDLTAKRRKKPEETKQAKRRKKRAS